MGNFLKLPEKGNELAEKKNFDWRYHLLTHHVFLRLPSFSQIRTTRTPKKPPILRPKSRSSLDFLVCSVGTRRHNGSMNPTLFKESLYILRKSCYLKKIIGIPTYVKKWILLDKMVFFYSSLKLQYFKTTMLNNNRTMFTHLIIFFIIT